MSGKKNQKKMGEGDGRVPVAKEKNLDDLYLMITATVMVNLDHFFCPILTEKTWIQASNSKQMAWKFIFVGWI